LRLTVCYVGLLVGLGLLILFCATTQVIAGVASFLVLFGCLYLLWLTIAEAVRRAWTSAEIKAELIERRRR
jgi:hypothetical protein